MAHFKAPPDTSLHSRYGHKQIATPTTTFSSVRHSYVAVRLWNGKLGSSREGTHWTTEQSSRLRNHSPCLRHTVLLFLRNCPNTHWKSIQKRSIEGSLSRVLQVLKNNFRCEHTCKWSLCLITNRIMLNASFCSESSKNTNYKICFNESGVAMVDCTFYGIFYAIFSETPEKSFLSPPYDNSKCAL